MSGAPNPSNQERNYAYLILSLSSLFLALNHVIARGVHEHVPPLGMSFWRWILPAVVLLPIVLADSRATLAVYREHWREFLLLGGLIVAASSLIVVALQYTTATNVALINATQPTLTVLFSWLFYGVRLRAVQVGGIVAAFAGVLVMVCQGSWGILAKLEINGGDLIALGCILGFAGYSMRYVRFEHGLSAVRAFFPIVIAGCALLLPFYVAESLLVRPVPVNPISIGAILALALLVTLSATLMFNIGLKWVGANRASMFLNLVPVFGAALAVTLLDEQFELYHLAGMILIAVGVWLVVRK